MDNTQKWQSAIATFLQTPIRWQGEQRPACEALALFVEQAPQLIPENLDPDRVTLTALQQVRRAIFEPTQDITDIGRFPGVIDTVQHKLPENSLALAQDLQTLRNAFVMAMHKHEVDLGMHIPPLSPSRAGGR